MRIDARPAAPGWTWLVAEGTTPGPGALEELLDAAERAGDAVLVSSRVEDSDGRLHPDALAWPEILRKEHAVAAARHRLLAIRAARHGSLLVRADVGSAPASPVGDLTWSAALLRDGGGYLAPRSVAVRAGPPSRLGVAEALDRMRMLALGDFALGERLWLLHVLARRARRREGAQDDTAFGR